jgi:hypothetical protein
VDVTSRRRGTGTSFAMLMSSTALAMLAGCNGFIGEAFVSRRATLAAHVATSDNRAGVPCTVTALLFGEEDTRAEVTSGAPTELSIAMMSPARVQAPVRARVALRVACQGYASVTTDAREVEVTVLDPPKVDFGTVTAASKE